MYILSLFSLCVWIVNLKHFVKLAMQKNKQKTNIKIRTNSWRRNWERKQGRKQKEKRTETRMGCAKMSEWWREVEKKGHMRERKERNKKGITDGRMERRMV